MSHSKHADGTKPAAKIEAQSAEHIEVGKPRKGFWRSYLALKLSRLNRRLTLASGLAAVFAIAFALPSVAEQTMGLRHSATADRLYTLDCGLTEFTDAAVFSDTGEYDGKPPARVKVVVAPFMQPKPSSECPAGIPC